MTSRAKIKVLERWQGKHEPTIGEILEKRLNAFKDNKVFSGIIAKGLDIYNERGEERAMDFLGKELKPFIDKEYLGNEGHLWYYLNEAM